MILFGVVLTAGTAPFVAAEFSLVAMDPATVDRRVAAGDRRAVGVQRALRQLSTELSGAQVGITLTTVLLGYTAQSAIVSLLTEPLGSAGLATAAAGADRKSGAEGSRVDSGADRRHRVDDYGAA